MITLTFFQPIVLCVSKGVYAGEMYKKRRIEFQNRTWMNQEQQSEEPHRHRENYFCSRVRDSNKRSPHSDIPTDVEEILNQCG